MILIVPLSLLLLFLFAKGITKMLNPELSKAKAYFDSSILFFLTMGHLTFFLDNLIQRYVEYYQQIDPIDNQYTPIAFKYILSFLFFYVLNAVSSFYIWKKGKKLPPLAFTLAICAMIYWLIICIPWSIQFLNHSDSHEYYEPQSGWIFMLTPLSFILFNLTLFIRVIKSDESNQIRNQYQNKFLNYLNNKLIDSQKSSVWILILFFPFLLIILCILQIFGQYPDSMVKVFTDTTTWTLSQKSHPPFLDHQGHYLCTVAACGSPTIVKPQKIGVRHGHQIIVNRQLSVANAFENIIETKFPGTHRVIRKNYDKYGYPLSKKITSRFGANLTYFFMKPLEWLFLAFIYFFSLKPEELIAKQYGNDL
nr:DUF6688 family protein [uncultured Fluviicola sp.]